MILKSKTTRISKRQWGLSVRSLSLAVLRLTIVLSVGLLSPLIQAQTTASNVPCRPFEPAEELIYKAEFSRSLLRKIDVANFKLTVSRIADPPTSKTAANDPLGYTLKLTGDAVSQGFFVRLFGLTFHQRVESTVAADSFAVQKTSRLDEQGKRVRASEAVFDHDRGQVTWVERDPHDPTRPERTTTSRFDEPIQDILSAIYSLRLRELQPGTKFEMPISDSGKVYRILMSVVEKKRMKTAVGNVSVVRVDPELFGANGMVKEDGKFSIWITDDRWRIPVGARLKTEYGTFDISLKKASHQITASVASTNP